MKSDPQQGFGHSKVRSAIAKILYLLQPLLFMLSFFRFLGVHAHASLAKNPRDRSWHPGHVRVPSSWRNPAPATPGYRTTSNCRREAAKQIANQRCSVARPPELCLAATADPR